MTSASPNYKYVRKWRHNVKARLMEALGNRCAICGYMKCQAAFDFHHIIGDKDFTIGGSTTTLSYTRLAAEAAKCVLLCVRCHREVHAGVAKVPSDHPRFDAELYWRRIAEEKEIGLQLRRKPKGAPKVKRWSPEWEKFDVLALRESGKSWAAIARMVGVSPPSVEKRFKKLVKLNSEL